jgi:dTDP-4-dehydrorhamnose reductase
MKKQMNILLIGNEGQLGKEVEIMGSRKGYLINAFDINELDITNPVDVDKVFSACKPEIVINTAAYTAVDKAETESSLAFAVNRDGPKYLAVNCARFNIPLIHISTDYVFDGRKTRPYTEIDTVSPVGIYAKSKAEGEKVILSTLKEHIILRTSWLYGQYQKNFVRTMLQLGQERDTLKVVNDQRGCPTCAADLAEAIWSVVDHLSVEKKEVWGIYHYCGKDIISWFEFAVAIFNIAVRYGYEKPPEVIPISTLKFPTPAKRPSFSALDCSKIENVFGISPKNYLESLEKTIRNILLH